MEEFDAPQEHGVKQLRETVERKDEQLKKLEAELASFKDKELNNVFGKLGLQTDNGFGKALKQVYDGPVDIESISQFAKMSMVMKLLLKYRKKHNLYLSQ